jgi:hypothetical protein
MREIYSPPSFLPKKAKAGQRKDNLFGENKQKAGDELVYSARKKYKVETEKE